MLREPAPWSENWAVTCARLAGIGCGYFSADRIAIARPALRASMGSASIPCATRLDLHSDVLGNSAHISFRYALANRAGECGAGDGGAAGRLRGNGDRLHRLVHWGMVAVTPDPLNACV